MATQDKALRYLYEPLGWKFLTVVDFLSVEVNGQPKGIRVSAGYAVAFLLLD